MQLVQKLPQHAIVAEILPPKQTMDEITVNVPDHSNTVSRALLVKKLHQLQARGLMDAGLVLVNQTTGILQGYLGQAELEFGLGSLSGLHNDQNMEEVRLLSSAAAAPSGEEEEEQEEQEQENIIDLSHFVDRTPLTLSAVAPMEYAVEMFGKLGLRYLMITEEGTGKIVGVVIKKRLVAYLDGIKNGWMNDWVKYIRSVHEVVECGDDWCLGMYRYVCVCVCVLGLIECMKRHYHHHYMYHHHHHHHSPTPN